MNDRLKIAIVGFGNIAKTHMTAIKALPLLKKLPLEPVLDTLITRDPSANERQAKLSGLVHVGDSLTHALESRQIDIVDICTPNSLHMDAVRTSARFGKALYIEKPLTENYANSLRLAEAAGGDVRHQVALVYRYHPAVMRMREAIKEGLIGDVLQFRMAYLRSGYLNPSRPMSWRTSESMSGGGAISDLGVHVLDLIRHLLGEIRSVAGDLNAFVRERPASANHSSLVPSVVDDWALMHVNLESGVKGTAEVSRIAWGAEGFQVHIVGNRGSLHCNLEKDSVPVLRLLDGSSPKLPEPSELSLVPDEKSTMGIAVDVHFGAWHHYLLRLAGEDRWEQLAPTIRDCLETERWIDGVIRAPISRTTAENAESSGDSSE